MLPSFATIPSPDSGQWERIEGEDEVAVVMC